MRISYGVQTCTMALAMVIGSLLAQPAAAQFWDFRSPQNAQSAQSTQNAPSAQNTQNAQASQSAAPSRPQTISPYQREVARANENTVSIISGNPNGTFLTIADDLANVINPKGGVRVLPIVGQGSIQNLKDVLFLRGVDMGIAHSNSLSYFRANGMGEYIDKIVYIAHLFNDEVHLYARPEIKSIKDLHGRRVNFSDAGSGSDFTARQMFDSLGVRPEIVNMSQAEAIAAMRTGDVAATFLLASKPSGVFSRLQKSDGFHFLPIEFSDAIAEHFLPAELTHEDYPALITEGESVETVSISTMLAAYDWPADSERYARLAKFTKAFFENFEEFRKAPRHPKWKDANLAAEVPTMRRFAPAQQWIEEHVRLNAQQEAMRGDFEEFLTTIGRANQFPENREALFREFLDWRARENAQ